MKKHLFYTFLLILVMTALVTIAGITKLIQIDEFYLKGLFGAFLIELVGTVISLYKKTDFFDDPQPAVSDSPSHLPVLNHQKLEDEKPNSPIEGIPTRAVVATTEKDSLLDLLPVTSSFDYLKSPRSLREYIKAEEQKLPILEVDKDKILTRFVGLTVDWELQAENIQKLDDESFEIVGGCKGTIASVKSGSMSIQKYPELKFLTKGTKFRLAGVISKIDLPIEIVLKDSKILPLDENALEVI